MENDTGGAFSHCADILFRAADRNAAGRGHMSYACQQKPCPEGHRFGLHRGPARNARTLGFSAWDAFRLVTLPQMLRIAMPVYQSTIVNLVQWTSVVGYVTITDLTRVINNTASRTMQPFLTISIGMLIYLAISYLVYGIFALYDKLRKMRRGGVPA